MQETYLDRRNLLPDPLAQFALWYEEAQQSTVALPHAMVLATADAQGRPSARMVLLKECDQRGFVFYRRLQEFLLLNNLILRLCF